ncbi:Growth inhibition and differentiation protein 88 [Paragonimus westermani]|uniref:Growth inhibition and differentiation protein 88 n=1 Tax=Paragonimus westermani TaxID=34504 RepID=A0A8T0DEL4_9TREM|nr:Growth inhibition and differentiation protein 88 [Paragonimus westermani]
MLPGRKPNQALYVPPALRDAENCSVLRRDDEPEKTDNLTIDDARNIPTKDAGLHSMLQSLSLSDARSSTKLVQTKRTSNLQDNSRRKSQLTEDNVSSEASNREPEIDYERFKHVLELYGFSKELDSADLQAELSGFEDSGFYLKWVDDTHCLAVFSSPSEADRALSQISGILFKAHKFEFASLESKRKLAKSPGDWAMPYKRRPLTTSATARRLIQGHLGLRSTEPRRQQELESEKRDKQLLAEARAQYERRKKAQKSMWEDDVWNF